MVTSSQGLSVKVDMDFPTAHRRLKDFDVLVVVGGSTSPIVSASLEPIPLAQAWAALHLAGPNKERTLLSICTGALLLAKAGLLQDLYATTHPDFFGEMESLCAEAARNESGSGTTIVRDARYVINNPRFEAGPDDVYVVKRGEPMMKNDPGAQNMVPKGSGSGAVRLQRERMPLGGLRVITAGGIMAGLDAALHLVAALVSIETAHEVARKMQHEMTFGLTVDGVDF